MQVRLCLRQAARLIRWPSRGGAVLRACSAPRPGPGMYLLNPSPAVGEEQSAVCMSGTV